MRNASVSYDVSNNMLTGFVLNAGSLTGSTLIYQCLWYDQSMTVYFNAARNGRGVDVYFAIQANTTAVSYGIHSSAICPFSTIIIIDL